MYGFNSLKDVLEVLLIPIVGGLIVLLWPELQAWSKRRRFERLIVRELEEIGPYPYERSSSHESWVDHQQRDFIHRRFLEEFSENRDFILALDPTLIYWVTQLWNARKRADHDQWLWYLGCLAKRYGGDVQKAHDKWCKLIDSYKIKP